MDLVLCHVTADFDTLGAAVGTACLRPGTRIVLTGGCHPAVREFLALHRDEYALIERRSVNPEQIRSLTVVDTQRRDRLGKAAEWLDQPHLDDILVCDHHLDAVCDIPATQMQIEPVGATATLIAEQLRSRNINLAVPEATVMALGIHVDTGSLTFDRSTARDAAALAWLMAQGASLRVIAEYVEPGLSPQLQDLLTLALQNFQTEVCQGFNLSWVLLQTEGYIPGLSSLASRLMELTESDALLLAAEYGKPVRGLEWQPSSGGLPLQSPDESSHSKADLDLAANAEHLTLIGRSKIPHVSLSPLFQPLGGGGHPRAAAAMLRNVNPQVAIAQLLEQLKSQIPPPQTARELMSSPVRTIRPETTIQEAQRVLLRYGHSGLSVVDAQARLVGIVSRRDIDLALHHGFSHAPVKGYMTTNLTTITPETLLPTIESLMVSYDIGRLPVLENNQLIGIVTRTDVLRQLHQLKNGKNVQQQEQKSIPHCPWPQSLLDDFRQRLVPQLWQLLATAAEQAEQRGWQLYLVGGAVRDFLLADANAPLMLDDIDLVVDGFHRAADQETGVELARSLQHIYPAARLQVHGQFQTAALLWHKDPDLDSLWLDIATARTEFYPYPAANPEVEASSIRQDLYRRDFTINALAVRLTQPGCGEILDYFGGLLDLQTKQVRVLHANSFIEDPTRIYRAVRFAVRLGFQIDRQTEEYIHHAITSGIYLRVQAENARTPALQTRLKSELKYILRAPYWKPALKKLSALGALRCIHPTLILERRLWHQVCLVNYWLKKAASVESEIQQRENSSPVFGTLSLLPSTHWQILLEVLIAYLEPEYRSSVASKLQLPADSIDRLQQLSQIQQDLIASLPDCQSPSQVVQLLRSHNLPALILVAVKSSRTLRHQIWQYLTRWMQVKAPLNGNDLKAMGYKPGPQFRQILDDLLAATLDGVIGERSYQSANNPQANAATRHFATAEAFLAENYPLTAK